MTQHCFDDNLPGTTQHFLDTFANILPFSKEDVQSLSTIAVTGKGETHL